MYKKNIYPTNPCPETPGKTLLNTNVPSTKMLNPKNTFNLFSKYKKYPSNLFIIQKISFTDFSRCLSIFFKIPKIPFTFFHYTTNTFTQIEAVPPWRMHQPAGQMYPATVTNALIRLYFYL